MNKQYDGLYRRERLHIVSVKKVEKECSISKGQLRSGCYFFAMSCIKRCLIVD